MLKYFQIVIKRPLIHRFNQIKIYDDEVNNFDPDSNGPVCLHHLLDYVLGEVRTLHAIVYFLLDLIRVIQGEYQIIIILALGIYFIKIPEYVLLAPRLS